jgi:flagellin-like hook-associated protein FlgL
MRIGSYSAGSDLTMRNSLHRAFARLDQSNVRLSTMRRINRGSDDPAGMIAAEHARAELSAVEAAGRNASRATGMLSVADSALSHVGELISQVRGNVVEMSSAGLSDGQMRAKQMEIDAALQAIDRIGAGTSFGGRQLFNHPGGTELSFAFSTNPEERSTVSLPEIDTAALGGAAGRLSDLVTGGSTSVPGGNAEQAMAILDAAGAQVRDARVQAGAFEKYTVEAAQRTLDQQELNGWETYSRIVDTDVAIESSRMVQAQILVQAATASVLLAGQQRAQIGSLLG